MNSITKQELKSIVGVQNFLDSTEDKLVYSYDGTPIYRQLPEAVVFPQNEEQISKILKLANQDKFNVVPRGSGTGLSGGSIPVENSVVVVMTKWNKILEVDVDNLTAWVQPGVVTGALQKEVEKIGLFYPPDPGSLNVCTIGGNVANNAGGLRGLKYGVTKNYVLGIEMILPSGEFLKTGGKNMKDAAGYNLRDFIVGSEGTIGIVTKVLLKLIPKPSQAITLLIYFDKLVDAAKTVSDIIASHIVPSMMEFLDNTTINCVEDYTKIGLPRKSEAILLIEVDGRGSIVQEDAETIRTIAVKNNASALKGAANETEANVLKTARRTAFSALARRMPTTILEDATVPRSELPVMIERVAKAAKMFDVVIGNFGHAGDGNLHPTCLTDERDSKEIDKAHRAFDFIFNEAIKLGGTITGEHGTGLAKKQFLEKLAGPVGVDMMKKIKIAMDPNNILNPGKIFTISPKCEGGLPINREQIKDFHA
ncbi:MAG: FAD-binding protein [Ignavibacteriaceae bacterium]|nr:FAD-binding protein [Ignavibacterium sp.]MCC6254365.1 FAD-binding protein [Ignavibacteriaceae bacterium]HRN25561.1 FAD-linked oxidase C-terminal domain-containing protein [Ignavibacteriaceae bacterium]HRP92353.1 FAD-linked oxidase C-terminal domain-containing protein [Ignavibacteriaceae bacterium]HRQ53096.1 FAD-linked oxidase C-terminal domain-containing protein [Ignavibacteriaceae bacterium]